MFFNRSLPGPVENPFRCLFSISFRYFVQFTRYTGSLPLRPPPALSNRPRGDSLVNITPPKRFVNPLFQKKSKKLFGAAYGPESIENQRKIELFQLVSSGISYKTHDRHDFRAGTGVIASSTSIRFLTCSKAQSLRCSSLPITTRFIGLVMGPGGPLLFGSFPRCLINA